TRLGLLLGRRADERRPRMEVLEVLVDGDRLGEDAAVVQLERGQLTARVLRRVRRPTVLGAEQVDVGGGDAEALLVEEHAEAAWVRAEGVVDAHGGHSFVFRLDALSRMKLRMSSAMSRSFSHCSW